MPNIAVTNFCNLSCPYCFANEFIAESDKQYLTQEQLITILNFLTTSSRSLGKIGIIGGEPTLHPNIKNLIESVCKCTIFTLNFINNTKDCTKKYNCT